MGPRLADGKEINFVFDVFLGSCVIMCNTSQCLTLKKLICSMFTSKRQADPFYFVSHDFTTGSIFTLAHVRLCFTWINESLSSKAPKYQWIHKSPSVNSSRICSQPPPFRHIAAKLWTWSPALSCFFLRHKNTAATFLFFWEFSSSEVHVSSASPCCSSLRSSS